MANVVENIVLVNYLTPFEQRMDMPECIER